MGEVYPKEKGGEGMKEKKGSTEQERKEFESRGGVVRVIPCKFKGQR
jgi:hypothetical protein